MRHHTILSLLAFLFFISIISGTVTAIEPIPIDFYYTEICGTCIEKLDTVILPIEEKFQENITIFYKDVNINLSYRDEMISLKLSYPSVVINKETRIPTQNLTYDTLDRIITSYIENQTLNETFNESIIYLPFIGPINTSALSLPVLTITLGTLDSFNPCAFFILLFLLNILIYVRSRRRMLLIGSIFIFFSGLFYFMFIFVLFNSLMITAQYITAVSLIAGLIAILIGILNIKDFFFFKDGPSLSIPKKRQPELFKKMRNLVKTTSFPAIFIGTIVLAVTVNFYELLCTLGFPLVFTTQLNNYNLPLMEYYFYILLYNIIYVIPLIIILLIFVFTLGRIKLSEWGGRQLKLLSGIMIFSFGLIFIINYQLLENIITPVLLLIVSIILTLIITNIFKQLIKKESNDAPPKNK